MTHLMRQGAVAATGTISDLQSLAAMGAVRTFANGISVECDDADFVIRLSAAHDESGCDTEWQVTVREPTPGLNTWWGSWRRTFAVPQHEAGPLMADELRSALTSVQAMLEDHANGGAQPFARPFAQQLAMQDA